MRFLTVQRLLLFIWWLGPRFDAGDVRRAWRNSHRLIYPLDGYRPYGALALWGQWLRVVL